MKLIHVLAALPFLGLLVGVAFADRVEPFPEAPTPHLPFRRFRPVRARGMIVRVRAGRLGR